MEGDLPEGYTGAAFMPGSVKDVRHFFRSLLGAVMGNIICVGDDMCKETGRMKIGDRWFETSGKTYVMGILNITPDSFSDGGIYHGVDNALFHADEMVRQGADIIDIGGESTKPGYLPVSEEDELCRVIPVIRAIRKRFSLPVSIDTSKAGVAREALEEGADLINDISALQGDEKMAEVVRKYNVPCCLMHQGNGSAHSVKLRSEVGQDTDIRYAEGGMEGQKEELSNEIKQDGGSVLVSSILADLKKILRHASKAGIDPGKVILDPGIGFGKTTKENLEILHHMGMFRELNTPLLLGASRKSVIGNTLCLPVDEREEGTLVTTVMAVQNGFMFVRVHNVLSNVRAVRMTEAICNR